MVVKLIITGCISYKFIIGKKYYIEFNGTTEEFEFTLETCCVQETKATRVGIMQSGRKEEVSPQLV